MDKTRAQPFAVRRAAAADAVALTRLGFAEPRYPALQLRLRRPGG
jgi:hypothetical protein